MSGGRVSIPNNVRKTIQNIKEITGNHSDDEIYAMLKECSMDPNETAQKLLLQDPFHEVKRKRDRKRENLNKESTDPRWKPGMQGRGNRGGRGNYSSRHFSNDAGGGRSSLSAKENGINQGAKDDQKKKEKFGVASSSCVIIDGSSDKKQSELTASIEANKGPTLASIEANKGPTLALGSKTPSPSPGVYLSNSDPILMPSQDSRLPVGTIRREVGNQRIQETPLEIKSTASPSEVQGAGKNLLSEPSRPAPSSHVSISVARPSSNYNNRLQQAIGPQKVGPGMEWKPKPTNPVPAQGTGTGESIKAAMVPSQPIPSNLDSKGSTREVEKKLEESRISDDQHVIIPNHLHVPEAEKLGFCFGSFDATFGFNATSPNDPVSDKNSEASEEAVESIEDPSPRNQNADEGDYPERPTSSNGPENLPVEGDMSSNVAPEYSESKQETSPQTTGQQYPAVSVHTSPNFSFGFMPPMVGTTQVTSFESNESQARDTSHVPSIVVQQPIDPASYYAQFYRSGADNDGRMSPFHSTGVPTKYNGNVALSPQSSQEVGNSLMLSAAGPTPIATQTASHSSVMQNSIAVTQQPLPVFRQPPGIHLPHYPPNYIPYGPYFSPFYVPPPAIHQFLSNGAFPQPPQPGGMYPAPPVAAPKYPLPQYKPGSNTGNSPHIGMPGNYGPYGSTLAGFSNPGSATTAGNSTSNEDLGGPQFKESNVYMTGQQSEGSGVWIPAPGRDMSGLPASSFYNLPQGGQVAYTPTQAGHGTFASIYHPGQPVTTGVVHPLLQQSQPLAGAGGDMVGPTASVYQQAQPSQINWPNNY